MSVIHTIKHMLSDYQIRSGTNKIISEIYQNGATVIKGFISQQICDEMVRDFEESLCKNNIKIWKDELGSDSRIFGVNKFSSAFADLYNNSDLAQYHKDYVGKKPVEGFSMCNKIKMVEGNKGSGNGWHRDSPFTHQFKAIIYLSDVTEDNGPFEYIENTHSASNVFKCARTMKKKSHTHRFNDSDIQKLQDAGLCKVTVTGKKGDLILVDTKVIHRGSPIRCGTRIAVTNYYYTSEIPAQILKEVN